jgi:ribosomal protein S18 acetylase RimI-like enzyme
MTDTVRVRLARAGDHAAMCAVLDVIDALHREAVPWLFREPETPPRPVDYFAEYLRGESCAALVADVGRIVGVALVLLRSTPDHALFRQRSYAVLDGIAVDPGSRRRGVGRQLVAGAQQWARARGADWLELNVYEFNRDAIAFYDALGFESMSRKMHTSLSDTTEP